MITLTILCGALLAIIAIVLTLGAGFFVIFGDIIVAVLVIMVLIKLIGAIRKKTKKEETTK